MDTLFIICREQSGLGEINLFTPFPGWLWCRCNCETSEESPLARLLEASAGMDIRIYGQGHFSLCSLNHLAIRRW